MVSQLNEKDWSRYLSTVGRFEGDNYLLSINALGAILSLIHRLSAVRTDLTTSLQKSIPQSKNREAAEDSNDCMNQLKSLLTNLIIMDNRLTKQMEKLTLLIKQSADQSSLQSAPIDEWILRSWGEAVKDAYSHIQGN